MTLGRPTDYSEEILTLAQEYIDECEDTEEQQLTGLSAKGTELYKQKLRVNIPTIEGLALHLGISRETVYAWEKEDTKKAFSDIIGRLRAKQAHALISKGLSGDYNPTIAKVLLTKHGYRDALDSDVTSKGEKLEGDSSERITELTRQLNELHQRGSVTSDGGAANPVDTEASD